MKKKHHWLLWTFLLLIAIFVLVLFLNKDLRDQLSEKIHSLVEPQKTALNSAPVGQSPNFDADQTPEPECEIPSADNSNLPPWDALLHLPKLAEGEEPEQRLDYYFLYNEEWEQPYWVSYTLTVEMIEGEAIRKNDFRPDPDIETGSATLADYKGSGYDRGHLAPSADMRRNAETQSASFFMSNMSPQLPGFNRGIWKDLEGWIRNQVATTRNAAHVVTGPYFEDAEYKTIGSNEVGVPDGYYKAILFDNEGSDDDKAIAFYLPHEVSDAPLTTFTLTIDELEAKIGFDLFCSLDDTTEDLLEAQCDVSNWDF